MSIGCGCSDINVVVEVGCFEEESFMVIFVRLVLEVFVIIVFFEIWSVKVDDFFKFCYFVVSDVGYIF